MHHDIPVICLSQTQLPELGPYALQPGLYAVNAARRRQRRRLSVLGVHGSGVLDGTFVAGRTDYQRILDRRGEPVGPDWVGAHTRGSLSAVLWDRDRDAVLVLPDPFGAGLVFRYDDGELSAVSPELGVLLDLLAVLGRRPGKSLGYLAELVVTTNGGLCHPASYAGISTLSPFEYLEISTRGVQSGTYRVRSEVFDPSRPYEDRLAAARTEIATNVAALAASPRRPKVLHLTGGFDTRLVLAAAMHLGVADRFNYLCIGPSDGTDKRISGALAAEFGLTMTIGTGVAVAEHPVTLTEQALWPIRFSHGMNDAHGPHQGFRTGPSVIGSGGYGELLRSFFSHRIEHDDPYDVDAIAGNIWGRQVISRNPEESLFAPDWVDHVHDSLRSRLDTATALGVRDDALWDYLYLTVRNRYFVGQISRLWTPFAARFDPLYSLSAAAAGLCAPLDFRAANVAGFDLMRSFAPALAELPFDYDRYSQAYRRFRGEPVRRAFTRAATTPRRRRLFNNAPVPAGQERFREPSGRDRELAARLGIRPAQAAGIDVLRQDVQRLAGEIAPATLNEIVNRPVFDRFLTNRINTRARFRAMQNLRTALLWYLDAEERTPSLRPPTWAGRLQARWHTYRRDDSGVLSNVGA